MVLPAPEKLEKRELTGCTDDCEELAGHNSARDAVNDDLLFFQHALALATLSLGRHRSDVDVLPSQLDLLLL